MTKQKLARRRNWAKLRISGMCFDKAVYTDNELMLVSQIEEHLRILKQFWDAESITQLGMKCSRYNVYHNGELKRGFVTRKEANWYVDKDFKEEYRIEKINYQG